MPINCQIKKSEKMPTAVNPIRAVGEKHHSECNLVPFSLFHDQCGEKIKVEQKYPCKCWPTVKRLSFGEQEHARSVWSW